MKTRDYIKKREELNADYKQKVEALEIVWRMFNPDEELPEVSIPDGQKVTVWKFPLTKRDAVKQSMSLLNGEFSTRDVRTALEQLNENWSASIDDDELSSLVAKIAQTAEGEFLIVQTKSGRSPAVYSRKERDQE